MYIDSGPKGPKASGARRRAVVTRDVRACQAKFGKAEPRFRTGMGRRRRRRPGARRSGMGLRGVGAALAHRRRLVGLIAPPRSDTAVDLPAADPLDLSQRGSATGEGPKGDNAAGQPTMKQHGAIWGLAPSGEGTQ
ncbi:hypothetical protein GCM10017687_85470 [Streptomyces echinatus]